MPGRLSYSNGCAQLGVPGVCTRVASYAQFISQSICDLSSDSSSS